VIDLRELRDDPDRFRASQRARGEDPTLVDRVLAADERRRSSAAAFDRLRAEQKQLGKRIGQASGADKAELLASASMLAAEVKAAPRATSPPTASSRATTSSSAASSARSIWSAGSRSAARASTT
jgi:seryl-tRNA synthetase